MNLYIRYFDEECVVSSPEEAYEFLITLPGVVLEDYFLSDLKQYMESNIPYPKRYKVRPRVYFIVIKTTAQTVEEFKENGARNAASSAPRPEVPRDSYAGQLSEERPGWYEGSVRFKRVIAIPGTTKFRYQDANFSARLKAYSGMDCYNRIIDHLRTRQDVDPRSQFPSVKGRNFSYQYLGHTLPE